MLIHNPVINPPAVESQSLPQPSTGTYAGDQDDDAVTHETCCSAFIRYILENHGLLSLISAFWKPKEMRQRPLWVTVYLFIVTVTVVWLTWANFAAIGLFSEFNCDSGCEEFNWPPTKGIVVNHALYNENAWTAGTAFCYPADGNRYAKPISVGGCRPSCSAQQDKDPLILKVTTMNVYEMCLGDEKQICSEDECFYTHLVDYEAMCNFDNLYMKSLVTVDWWVVAIFASIAGTVSAKMASWFIVGRCSKKPTSYSHGQVEKTPIRGCGFVLTAWIILPVFMVLFFASILNPVFGRDLMYTCYLIGELRGWVMWFLYSPVIFYFSERKKKGLYEGTWMEYTTELSLFLLEYV